MPKWALLGLVSLLSWIGAAGVGYHGWQQIKASQAAPPPTAAVVIAAPTGTPTPDATATPAATPTPTPAPTPLPASVLLKVPFTSQFPFQAQNHGFYEDFCEAAGTLMTGAYWSGDNRALIPGAEADSRMREIVNYERASFGTHQLNLSLADVAQSGNHFYGLQGQVVALDLDVMKRDLANGRPVIVPLMTHVNGAPIYPGYGRLAVYHVLLVIGYDTPSGRLYANDAGLYNGEHLSYPWPTILNAATAMTETRVDGAGSAVPYQQGLTMLVFSK